MSWKLYVRRAAIRLALWQPTPNTIPLSDREEMRKRNYAVVRLIDREGGFRYIPRYLTRRGARALFVPSDGGPAVDGSVLNSAIEHCDLQIDHYFREIEVRYNSALEYCIHRWTGAVPFFALRDWFGTVVYRTRRVARRDRMKVLQAFVDATLKKGEASFSEVSLPGALHGSRWIRLDESDEIQRYYRLVLHSLAVTNDLERAGASYVLTAQGVATLAQYQTDARRHSQTFWTQVILAVLTFGLIVLGLGQVAVDLLNGTYTHGMFGAAAGG